jgi:hypothetical protein
VPRRPARPSVINSSPSREQTQLGEVLPPDDFDAQAKMVMANLTKALAAGGPKSPT